MGEWCLRASSFIYYRIISKVAGNQDRHNSSDEFDFGPLVSMAHLNAFFFFFKSEDVNFGLWMIKSFLFFQYQSDVAAHNSPRPFGFISFKQITEPGKLMSIEKGITCSYTHGIYAEGYITFVFPFVCSSVRMFIRSFVTFRRVGGIYIFG